MCVRTSLTISFIRDKSAAKDSKLHRVRVSTCRHKGVVDEEKSLEFLELVKWIKTGPFTAYRRGLTRGKGPTIFELAFRSADLAGSPKLFEDATNMFLSNVAAFDLERTTPLNGDLITKLLKRKGHATGKVSPQDSYRHDRILITSPNTRSVKRKNLNQTIFARMPTKENQDVPIVNLSEDDKPTGFP